MQNSWIHLASGTHPRQARVGVSELHEEHVSRDGFYGPTAMLYHGRPPADPVRVVGPMRIMVRPLAALTVSDESMESGLPNVVAFNDDVRVSVCRRSTSMPFLLRNIDADSLYFIHEGAGTIATEFGPLAYREGDFVLIPKGVTFRVMPDAPTTALVVESVDAISLTEHRQVGRHAPFDTGVLGVPQATTYDWPEQAEWELRLKHGDHITSAFYAQLPFDVVGWKGDLFPFTLNIDDIRPITSERLHLAPSAWSVFEAAGFMCVAFLPMSIVTDTDAEELPSRHRNLDTDELVLIRRTGGAPTNVIAHFPQGVTHGPTKRGNYDETREVGMRRLLEGISIDSVRRLWRTPLFLGSTASNGDGSPDDVADPTRAAR